MRFLAFLTLISLLLSTGAHAITLDCARAFARPYLETNSHWDTYREAVWLAEKHGPENTLVAFDIDGTILYLPGKVGTEEWWAWQGRMIREENPERLVNSADELRLLVGEIYRAKNMRYMDPELPKVLEKLAEAGIPTVILTARGSVFSEITLLELERMGLRKYFEAGILMTGWHDKGEYLDYFLTESGRRVDAIVFADDKLHNLDSLAQRFEDRKEFVGIRFNAIDPMLDNYHDPAVRRQAGREFLELRKDLNNDHLTHRISARAE